MLARLLTCLLMLTPLIAAPLPDSPILPIPASANQRIATIQVRVSLDRPDWNYRLGEKPVFHVVVTADNQPIRATIDYRVGPEMLAAETIRSEITEAGIRIEAPALTQPGFLRFSAEVRVAGRTYRGLATAAFEPTRIQAAAEDPQDFDAFWSAAKAELATTPLEPRLTRIPEACTAAINVYHVSFRSTGQPWAGEARIYGILCEPTSPGPHPALLRVPGAGVRPYLGDRDLAAKGVITLEIGIHGIPVNLPQSVYDDLKAGALIEYFRYGFSNPDRYYYRRVILGCLQANNFLASRPTWDGRHLAVAGASQGGFLSIATAALDPRVTFLSATHPAFCDLTAILQGRASGWPHPFYDESLKGAQTQSNPRELRTAALYDTVNFARRLRAPGFYIFGYNDEVCTPSSIYAALNQIKAPKSIGLTLEMGHSYSDEQGSAINAQILRSFTW